MQQYEIDKLRQTATHFRTAIERARAERASPSLPYFPEGACKMVSWLLAMHLGPKTDRNIQFVTGHIPGCEPYVRHAWLEIDDIVIDLTADPFGEAPVVVGAPTRFHESLDYREERDAAAGISAFTDTEATRYQRWLQPIEERMPPSGERRA